MKFWAGFMGARFQEQILKKFIDVSHIFTVHTHVHVLSFVNAYMCTILNCMSTVVIFFHVQKVLYPVLGDHASLSDLFFHCQCWYICTLALSTPRAGFFAKSTNLLDKFIMQLSRARRPDPNNPSQKSVVLEYSAKTSQGLVWHKIQEPLTQGAKFPGVVEVKVRRRF